MRWFAWISSFLALIAFADIGEDLHDPGWPALEQRLAAPLLALRTPWLTKVMLSCTWFGSQLTLAVVVVLACLFLRRRDSFTLVFAALSTSLLNLVLKSWFLRARPGAESMPLAEEPYYSFPSGHTMISLVVYGFLAYLVWQRRRRGEVVVLLGLLIGAIATSRVYLAVHYPGDVLAGLVAGWPCLCLAIALHRRDT